MEQIKKISYEEYRNGVQYLTPVIDNIQRGIMALPNNTKLEDIIAALCICTTNIISAADGDSDDFSLDAWYAMCMEQVVTKIKEQ